MDYFKNSDTTLCSWTFATCVRVPTGCRPHGVIFAAPLAIQQLLSRSEGRQFCGISHFLQFLQTLAKEEHQVWPLPLTTIQIITYHQNILLSFDIYHITQCFSLKYTTRSKKQLNIEYSVTDRGCSLWVRAEAEVRVEHGAYNTIRYQQLAEWILWLSIILQVCGGRRVTLWSGVLNETLIFVEFVEVHCLVLNLMFITMYTRVRQIGVPYTVNIS